MKIWLIILLFTFISACSQPKGEIVPAPAGMEDSVKTYISGKERTFRGMNVRSYPKELYLVSADVENLSTTDTAYRKQTWQLIVQKAENAGQIYWQVKRGSENELKELQK